MMLSTTTSSSRSIRSTRSGRRARGASAWLGTSAAIVLLMTGCAAPASDQGGSTAPSAGGTTSTDSAREDASASSTAPLSVEDPWIKAVKEEDMMTAVFATLTNTTDQDLQIVDARTPVADAVELHETVDDGSGATMMQEKEGGFTVPAGEALTLVPGGNHLMPMGLNESIEPGQTVEVVVEFSDGSTQTLTAVAKDYAGANETYEGTDEASDSADHGAGHDMGDMGDMDQGAGHGEH